MAQMIDVSGLPDEVVEDIQKLVADIRQNLAEAPSAPRASDEISRQNGSIGSVPGSIATRNETL